MLRRRRAGRSDEGLVLVLVALMLVGLFGISALVIDMGYARQESRHAQASADAAALAGARELPLDGFVPASATSAKQQAAKYVNINVAGASSTPASSTCTGSVPPNATCHMVGDASVVIATPYVDTSFGAPPAYSLVYVKICQPTPTFLSGVLGQSSPTVCREAVGRRFNPAGGYGLGLVVMDPVACSALTFAGHSTTQLSSNGAVMVNSECTDSTNGALNSTGSAWNLEASYIGVVGSATLSPCDPELTDNCTSTVPTEGIPHFEDPFDLSPPDELPDLSTTSACTSTGGATVLQPGRYPPRCTFNQSAYIFRPGVYYFEQGFQTSGGAALVCSETATTYPLPADSTCSGVTFIVADGGLTMNGGSEVFLPPPTGGDYAGVSIYQLGSDTSTINGSAQFVLGTIYAPDAPLKFTGSGANSNPATADRVNIDGMVIGRTADISGSFFFNINVPEDDPASLVADDIGLED